MTVSSAKIHYCAWATTIVDFKRSMKDLKAEHGSWLFNECNNWFTAVDDWTRLWQDGKMTAPWISFQLSLRLECIKINQFFSVFMEKWNCEVAKLWICLETLNWWKYVGKISWNEVTWKCKICDSWKACENVKEVYNIWIHDICNKILQLILSILQNWKFHL